MKLVPTQEQKDIIELALNGEDIVINAFAGASKSTTLVMIAEAKEEAGGENGMYLAFNKVIANEAEDKFPPSVECRTVHSLAYKYTPKELKKKLNFIRKFPKELSARYNVKGEFVHSKLQQDKRKLVSFTHKINMANEAIKRFCNSVDESIDARHIVPLDWMVKFEDEYDLDQIFAEVVVIAREHWKSIIDPDSDVPLTHDAYLKLFSMKGKQLGISYIMVDENQDSSPVILKIVEDQKLAQKIYVGDKYQAIYGWRGAINAMDIVTGEVKYLTKSFRFGENIQNLARGLLSVVNCEVPIHGNGSQEGQIYVNSQEMRPDAVISRTNVGVLRNVFEYSDKYPNLTIGASCDVDAIQKFVYAYNDLTQGKQTTHPLLMAFESLKELNEYCDENPDDIEVTGFVKLLNKFGSNALLSVVHKCSGNIKCDIMCTTAHKSKGLEWDNVAISGDFFYDAENLGEIVIENEELNLIYVACTRAKKNIDVGGIFDLLLNIQVSSKGETDFGLSLPQEGILPLDSVKLVQFCAGTSEEEINQKFNSLIKQGIGNTFYHEEDF